MKSFTSLFKSLQPINNQFKSNSLPFQKISIKRTKIPCSFSSKLHGFNEILTKKSILSSSFSTSQSIFHQNAQKKKENEVEEVNSKGKENPPRQLLKTSQKKGNWRRRRETAAVREVYQGRNFEETRDKKEDETLECTAHYTAEEYNINDLYLYLSSRSSGVFISSAESKSTVVSRPYKDGDVFYFEGGSVVFWGVSQSDAVNVLQELKKFEKNPVSVVPTESMDYTFTDANSHIRDDIIFLTENQDKFSLHQQQLAFSYGFHQSVKLSYLEEEISDQIKGAKDIQGRLVEKRRWLTDTKTHLHINRLLSNFLSIRAALNLHSDLLGTPDIFWDHPALEKFFLQMTKNMEINSRIDIVNRRLEESGHVLELLKTELTTKHGSRLEVLIIWLITVEVVIAILPYITSS
eukprot:TRINITY_DN2670_c0_g1_i1.p1 TRINITY_DN2670_c0_g1~~TRINITY_DN2670_c0_g1_i1.p1  ORF type:complete len:415 (-),score=144.71 TRINITY_DN2670_c0_g1_i1:192-1412(-)